MNKIALHTHVIFRPRNAMALGQKIVHILQKFDSFKTVYLKMPLNKSLFFKYSSVILFWISNTLKFTESC